MEDSLPQPIVYSLDAEKCARLRAHLLIANGVRNQVLSNGLLASLMIFNGINLARDGVWNGVFSWCFVLFSIVLYGSVSWLAFERCRIRPQTATTLTFDDTGFSLERSELERSEPHARRTHISCARVRSVRITSKTFGIYGAWRTYAIIPRDAHPDGGTQLERFFAERIVSEGMPVRIWRGVTTIDNSVTPFFARG